MERSNTTSKVENKGLKGRWAYFLMACGAGGTVWQAIGNSRLGFATFIFLSILVFLADEVIMKMSTLQEVLQKEK